MTEPKIEVCENIEDLQNKIREYILNVVQDALKHRNKATLGVSGGSMPKLVAPLLAKMDSINWEKVHIFAADERMELLSDAESNTGAYLRLLPDRFRKSFLEYGPIEDTAKCAQNYAESLKKCDPEVGDGWPIIDLLLLGIGPDGHTCSLFPGHHLLSENSQWVVPIEDSPKPPPRRITLTLPVLNHARHVAFISTGEGKAAVIKSIVRDRDQKIPAALVQPISGSLHWFVDKSAASLL